MRKEDLVNTMQNIHMPADMQERIAHRMAQTDGQNKEVPIFMLRNKKRMAAVVIAAAVVCGSAFAFGSTAVSSILSGSSSVPDYTALPTAQQCEKDAGYAPTLIDSFDNDYTFTDGTVFNSSMKNEEGQNIESYKGFFFEYANGDETMTLTQKRYFSETEDGGTCIAQDNDVSYYETDQTYKFVPADYELTEQDKQDEASGRVVFSCGSDEVETHQIHSLTWEIGNMHYCLMQQDGSLTGDQLLDMARQITAAAQ